MTFIAFEHFTTIDLALEYAERRPHAALYRLVALLTLLASSPIPGRRYAEDALLKLHNLQSDDPPSPVFRAARRPTADLLPPIEERGGQCEDSAACSRLDAAFTAAATLPPSASTAATASAAAAAAS